jgi:adenylate kinase family enzyme
MRGNRDTPLALQIRDRLDNQGFLTSTDLNPFICQAIKDAHNQKAVGILIDGFPRCIEQLESWNTWPFQDKLQFESSSGVTPATKPDVVLSLRVTRENAKARYVARARDANDQAEKFDKRFAEYENETIPVEEVYRKRGILIEVSFPRASLII